MDHCYSRYSLVIAVVIVVFAGAGCAPATAPVPSPTSTQTPKPEAIPTSIPTTISSALPTVNPAAEMNQGVLPLSQPGDYFTGKQRLSLVDASRGGREVSISIFYPAVKPEGFKGTIVRDAPPDNTAAPYPVILTATKIADIFAPHLVTHGFTVISVDLNVEGDAWDLWLIDFPLDLLFALD